MVELNTISKLTEALKFVSAGFLLSDRVFYNEIEFKIAQKALVEIYSAKELELLVKTRKARVFAYMKKGQIKGVCALEVIEGKILFISTLPGDVLVARALIEKMVEARSEEPDNRLHVLAFVGQEKQLQALGFVRLYDSTLYYHGLKLVPMKYNYAQFNIDE